MINIQINIRTFAVETKQFYDVANMCDNNIEQSMSSCPHSMLQCD